LGEFLDLVILDLMPPQINGLDICRLLRHQGNPVPILILSAKEVKPIAFWIGSGEPMTTLPNLSVCGSYVVAVLCCVVNASAVCRSLRCYKFKEVILIPRVPRYGARAGS